VIVMEYIYAALLLHHAGKGVNEQNVKAVLTAAGVTADDSRVKALVAALEDVNIEEAISKAAIAAPVAAAPAAAPAAAAPAEKEEKKEEKKEEEEESGMAGLGALFG
jgi:large subunit ribosomal protein L12